jgi:hypothetical protein
VRLSAAKWRPGRFSFIAAPVFTVEVYLIDEDGEQFVHEVGADNRNEARVKALAIQQQISAGDFHPEPL